MCMFPIAGKFASAAALVAVLLVSGCASSGSAAPVPVAQDSLCPPGLTPSCVEYNGDKLRCFCGNREDLREVLEPYGQPPH